MQLFYQENIDDEFELSKEESRHLVKVLRKKNGDQLNFTDGKGGKYSCVLIDDNPKHALIKVEGIEQVQASIPKLTIAIAPTKNNDRLEWFLEKSTEIGITNIIPFISEHSERKTIKTSRLEKIIISAMKQSLKYHKPELEELTTFEEIISRPYSYNKYVAHLETENPQTLKSSYMPGEDSIIIIGPEGDFSPVEIQLAKEKSFNIVSLGNSRLRTETAGLVACHTIDLLNQ